MGSTLPSSSTLPSCIIITIHHPSLPFIILHYHSSSFITIHHPSLPFIILHYHLSSSITIHHPSLPFIILHYHSSSFNNMSLTFQRYNLIQVSHPSNFLQGKLHHNP